MQTITIAVQSEEFETINIDLTQEEVLALYKLRKEQTAAIADLSKKLEQEEKNKKYAQDESSKRGEEIDQANTLLTALGIPDKTDHEESYYRKNLSLSTRIALYIAKAK